MNKKYIAIAGIAILALIIIVLIGGVFGNNQNDSSSDVLVVTTESTTGAGVEVVTTESTTGADAQTVTTESTTGADAQTVTTEDVSGAKDQEDTFLSDGTTYDHPEDEDDYNYSNDPDYDSSSDTKYYFRTNKKLKEHYEKHGIEMGFDNAEEYEAAASKVVNNPDALHKTEKEDGDDVYYIEETNEFVIVSKDGYLRTYFNPSRGIDYYNSQ